MIMQRCATNFFIPPMIDTLFGLVALRGVDIQAGAGCSIRLSSSNAAAINSCV